MPIFEYRCRSCGSEFERLVRSGDSVTCRSCGGGDLKKLFSTFGFGTKGGAGEPRSFSSSASSSCSGCTASSCSGCSS